MYTHLVGQGVVEAPQAGAPGVGQGLRSGAGEWTGAVQRRTGELRPGRWRPGVSALVFSNLDCIKLRAQLLLANIVKTKLLFVDVHCVY